MIVILLLTPVLNVPGPLFVKSPDVYLQVLLVAFSVFWAFKFHWLPFKKLVFPIFATLLVLVSQTLINEIIYQFGDSTAYTFIRLSLTISVAYICAIVLIETKKDLALSFFFKTIIFAALLQGTVIWLSFFIPAFRDVMSVVFYRAMVEGADHLYLLRVPGFVPTGGDGLSMNQSLLSVSGLMGVFLYFKTSRYRNLLVIGLLFSMLSTAFTGRTGLYLGVFFFVLVFATQSNNFRISRGMVKLVVIALAMFVPIVIFSQQIGIYGQFLLEKHGYEYPIVRLLNGFIAMQYEGGYTDNTIQTLLGDMVIVPNDPIRFLFGNGNFGQMSSATLASDVGYFRMWHGIGLFGLFVFIFGLFIYPLMKIRSLSSNVRKYIVTKTTDSVVFSNVNILSFVLLYGLIGHYKIFFLTTRIYAFVFFVLLFLIYNQLRSIQRERTS